MYTPRRRSLTSEHLQILAFLKDNQRIKNDFITEKYKDIPNKPIHFTHEDFSQELEEDEIETIYNENPVENQIDMICDNRFRDILF